MELRHQLAVQSEIRASFSLETVFSPIVWRLWRRVDILDNSTWGLRSTRKSVVYQQQWQEIFPVHTAVYRNVISRVKPTRCTNVSNLFLFWNDTLQFWTVFPSIIRSTNGYPLASRQQYLFDKCLSLYVQSWTADDGRKDRPKHVECHSKIK